jgi:hypothetical protein
MAELLDFTGDEHGYYEALRERWDGTLVVVEQDIVIHETVLPEFAECERDWCAFGYPYGSLTCAGLMVQLGCVRFSAALRAGVAFPDEPIHWHDLANVLLAEVGRAGYRCYVHGPPVRHDR